MKMINSNWLDRLIKYCKESFSYVKNDNRKPNSDREPRGAKPPPMPPPHKIIVEHILKNDN